MARIRSLMREDSLAGTVRGSRESGDITSTLEHKAAPFGEFSRVRRSVGDFRPAPNVLHTEGTKPTPPRRYSEPLPEPLPDGTSEMRRITESSEERGTVGDSARRNSACSVGTRQSSLVQGSTEEHSCSQVDAESSVQTPRRFSNFVASGRCSPAPATPPSPPTPPSLPVPPPPASLQGERRREQEPQATRVVAHISTASPERQQTLVHLDAVRLSEASCSSANAREGETEN